MKYIDIATMSDVELLDKLKVEKDLYSKLKFAHAISPIENPSRIKSVRRTIAQLNTQLTKRK